MGIWSPVLRWSAQCTPERHKYQYRMFLIISLRAAGIDNGRSKFPTHMVLVVVDIEITMVF